MQTVIAEKTLQQKLQEFEHFRIRPLAKSSIMFQYDRYKSLIRFLHKNYLIIQKRQALLKEKVKYQSELMAKLQQKYLSMPDRGGRNGNVATLCGTRIFSLEAPLMYEYQLDLSKIRSLQFAVFSPMIARLKVRLQVTADKEVSDFEELRRNEAIDLEFMAVTKEQLQKVAIARFAQTLQLIEYIEKEEEKSLKNQIPR